MASSTTTPEAHHPAAASTSDGAADEHGQAGLESAPPAYNNGANSVTVLNDMHEYLKELSAAIDARLQIIEYKNAGYEMAMIRGKRILKALVVAWIIITVLWLATFIMVLVAVSNSQPQSK